MNFLDYLRWIFRALWMQRLRSVLTIVGFAIGIAAMVLLSSLGEGLRQFVIQEFTQFGSHIVAITPGKTETFGMGGILNTTRPLSLEDSEALKRIPGVEQVVPVVFGTAQIKAVGRSRYTDVAGALWRPGGQGLETGGVTGFVPAPGRHSAGAGLCGTGQQTETGVVWR